MSFTHIILDTGFHSHQQGTLSLTDFPFVNTASCIHPNTAARCCGGWQQWWNDFYLCASWVPPNFVVLLQSIINNFQCLLFSKGYTDDRSATSWKEELRLLIKCQHDEGFTDSHMNVFDQWDLPSSLTDRVCLMFNDLFITSAEGGIVFGSVGLFVCLSAR